MSFFHSLTHCCLSRHLALTLCLTNPIASHKEMLPSLLAEQLSGGTTGAILQRIAMWNSQSGEKFHLPWAIGLGFWSLKEVAFNWLNLLKYRKVHLFITIFIYLQLCIEYNHLPSKSLGTLRWRKKAWHVGATDGLCNLPKHLVGGLVPLLCGLSHPAWLKLILVHSHKIPLSKWPLP